MIKHSSGYEILIISPRFYEQLLKNRFPSTFMTPVPVLGYRKVEKLSDPQKRVMSICSPLAPGSDIHGRVCKIHASRYFHDMDHLFLESANPHREAWIHRTILIGIELMELENMRCKNLKKLLLSKIGTSFWDTDTRT